MVIVAYAKPDHGLVRVQVKVKVVILQIFDEQCEVPRLHIVGNDFVRCVGVGGYLPCPLSLLDNCNKIMNITRLSFYKAVILQCCHFTRLSFYKVVILQGWVGPATAGRG